MPRRTPDELTVKQVKIYTDAFGKGVRPRMEKTIRVPPATGNMNSKEDHINFFLYADDLALTADGGHRDGVTTTIKTFLTYKRGITRTKVRTEYTEREAVITRFLMREEYASEVCYAYTATYL